MELRLYKDNLPPFEDIYLYTFNDSIMYPCCNMELLVSFEEGEDKRTRDVCLVVVPCENIYSCILGRPFFIVFHVIVSIVNLKIKYHSDLGELVTYL